jgi:hypothetical protein
MTYSGLLAQNLARDGAPPPAKFDAHGVLTLASGREGRLVFRDSGVDFPTTLGFLGSKGKRVKLVGGLDIPRFLVAMLRKDLALKALRDASLVERLSQIHPREEVEAAIREALEPLEAEEAQSVAALEGLFGRPGARVRYDRVGGEFFFSAIDLAMVAKACDYKTAQKLVWRLAEEYFEGRLGENRAEKETSCLLFRTILFEGQRGRPAPCLTVDKAVEFLMVIPGSEISASVRREASRSLLRIAGGDESLIATIEENRKLQEYLRAHDPEHPLRAAGEFAEKRRREEERDERLAKLLRAEVESVVKSRMDAAVGELRGQLQAVVSALPTLMPIQAHVSLNASTRSTAQLSRVTVRPPRNEAERRDLVGSTLLVSTYLHEKIEAEYPRLSLLERRGLYGAIRSFFSSTLENLKLQRSGAVPRVAQIARSQPHYTREDRPLMDEAWMIIESFRASRHNRVVPARPRRALRRPAAA